MFHNVMVLGNWSLAGGSFSGASTGKSSVMELFLEIEGI